MPVPVHLSLSLHLLTGDESEVIPSVGSTRGKVCALPTHLCLTRDPRRRPRGRPQSLHWGVALQTPGLSRSRCCRAKREADRGCDVCARWLSSPVCLWSRGHSCCVKWIATPAGARDSIPCSITSGNGDGNDCLCSHGGSGSIDWSRDSTSRASSLAVGSFANLYGAAIACARTATKVASP